MKNKRTIIIASMLSAIGILLIIIICNITVKNPKNEGYYSTYIIHTVSEKDTLEKIAIKYNLFEDEILKINNLKSKNEVKEGTKLKIPNVTIYTLSEDTTLDQISSLFEMTKHQLKIANDMSDDKDIERADMILIPNRIIYQPKKDEKIKDVAKKINLPEKTLKKCVEKNTNVMKKDVIYVLPIRIGTKKINGVELTREEYESYKTLNALATTLYNSGEYKNFSYSDKGHYMIVDAAKGQKEDIEDYLLNCVITDPIITFDFSDKQNLNKKHKFGLRYDCSKDFK